MVWATGNSSMGISKASRTTPNICVVLREKENLAVDLGECAEQNSKVAPGLPPYYEHAL